MFCCLSTPSSPRYSYFAPRLETKLRSTMIVKLNTSLQIWTLINKCWQCANPITKSSFRFIYSPAFHNNISKSKRQESKWQSICLVGQIHFYDILFTSWNHPLSFVASLPSPPPLKRNSHPFLSLEERTAVAPFGIRKKEHLRINGKQRVARSSFAGKAGEGGPEGGKGSITPVKSISTGLISAELIAIRREIIREIIGRESESHFQLRFNGTILFVDFLDRMNIDFFFSAPTFFVDLYLLFATLGLWNFRGRLLEEGHTLVDALFFFNLWLTSHLPSGH